MANKMLSQKKRKLELSTYEASEIHKDSEYVHVEEKESERDREQEEAL